MTLIEQDKSKAGHYQATFSMKKQYIISRNDIMINFPLGFITNGNKLTVPEEEIRKMIGEFRKLYQH